MAKTWRCGKFDVTRYWAGEADGTRYEIYGPTGMAISNLREADVRDLHYALGEAFMVRLADPAVAEVDPKPAAGEQGG